MYFRGGNCQFCTYKLKITDDIQSIVFMREKLLRCDKLQS